jgi:hypothetical protein
MKPRRKAPPKGGAFLFVRIHSISEARKSVLAVKVNKGFKLPAAV